MQKFPDIFLFCKKVLKKELNTHKKKSDFFFSLKTFVHTGKEIFEQKINVFKIINNTK